MDNSNKNWIQLHVQQRNKATAKGNTFLTIIIHVHVPKEKKLEHWTKLKKKIPFKVTTIQCESIKISRGSHLEQQTGYKMLLKGRPLPGKIKRKTMSFKAYADLNQHNLQ